MYDFRRRRVYKADLGKALGAEQFLGDVLRRGAQRRALGERDAGGFRRRLRRACQIRGKQRRGRGSGHPGQKGASVHVHAFSSRFSSLKKRQSVLPSMIRLGGILISPASRSRNA